LKRPYSATRNAAAGDTNDPYPGGSQGELGDELGIGMMDHLGVKHENMRSRKHGVRTSHIGFYDNVYPTT
jgi:hypothetical protein